MEAILLDFWSICYFNFVIWFLYFIFLSAYYFLILEISFSFILYLLFIPILLLLLLKLELCMKSGSVFSLLTCVIFGIISEPANGIYWTIVVCWLNIMLFFIFSYYYWICFDQSYAFNSFNSSSYTFFCYFSNL